MEADTYDISRDMPVFMTVGENGDTSEGYTKYLKKCNAYFTVTPVKGEGFPKCMPEQ